MEFTLDDRLARLKGVAEPLRPFTALTVLEALAEDLDGTDEVTLFLRVDFVGVGDLEVALDEAGVDNLDLDELGVSVRSSLSKYFGFTTLERLDLEPEIVSSSSESMSR